MNLLSLSVWICTILAIIGFIWLIWSIWPMVKFKYVKTPKKYQRIDFWFTVANIIMFIIGVSGLIVIYFLIG